MKYLIFLKALFLIACIENDLNYVSMESPNGEIQATISNEKNKLVFSTAINTDTIINKSPIGLLVNGYDFTNNIKIHNLFSKTYNETWKTINGKNSIVRNNYNEYRFSVSSENSIQSGYQIVFRMYNDGFAYRYLFPSKTENDSIKITEELTQLMLTKHFTYWAYNGEHHPIGPNKSSTDKLSGIMIPMVIKFDDNQFMAIHEAEIVEFAPFTLKLAPRDNSIKFNINYSSRSDSLKTSWRTFIIGNKPGNLVESNILVNLNEPCKIEDPSWIKPGKSLWDWRVWGYKAPDGFVYGLNTISHKRFIDFASKNNIQYLVIDADWYGAEFSKDSDPTSARDGINIENCMAYAKKKKIGIILYLNDIGAKKFGLERVLKQFADWGAVGVKYGFMKGTPEEKVKHTRDVVELCAKYKLMVDFHDDPIPPSGDRRTWPNLMTKEFGHAQADAKRSYYPETAVNTALINMIAGPLDMTNGWFDLNNAHSREKVFQEIPGTLAGEIAKLIVYYSGWMILPDAPEAYLKYDDLFEIVRQMPSQFDSFKILDAELDKYVVVARKAGEDWFVGALTNRDARNINLSLDFLDSDNKYIANLYMDTPNTHFINNKEMFTIKKGIIVDNKNVLELKLSPGGGQAIHIMKK